MSKYDFVDKVANKATKDFDKLQKQREKRKQEREREKEKEQKEEKNETFLDKILSDVTNFMERVSKKQEKSKVQMLFEKIKNTDIIRSHHTKEELKFIDLIQSCNSFEECQKRAREELGIDFLKGIEKTISVKAKKEQEAIMKMNEEISEIIDKYFNQFSEEVSKEVQEEVSKENKSENKSETKNTGRKKERTLRERAELSRQIKNKLNKELEIALKNTKRQFPNHFDYTLEDTQI